MAKKRIMGLSLFFELPNGFNKDVNEGIIEYINYRLQNDEHRNTKPKQLVSNWNDLSYAEQWNYFFTNILNNEECDDKMVGNITYYEIDENNKMINLLHDKKE